MRSASDVVLTNVVVRDKKTGKVIPGLKASDFSIAENGKPQKVSNFQFENVDEVAALQEKTVTGQQALMNSKSVVDETALKDHRLVVMLFDLTSMQQEDVDRAVDSAKNFVNKQMSPADLVALVSLAGGMSLDQDFTSDKQLLLRGLGRYNGSEGQGFQNGNAGGTTNGTADTSADFTPDETEFNAVNTDRKLYAIQTIAQSLSRISEKKSLMFFSSGVTRTGIENQASLRAATNAAVKANMAIYSIDAAGLEVLNPVGDATTGSLRGSAAYNGVAMQNQLDANFQAQETLTTLSGDTGGKAFLDSNDFAPAFQQMERDTSQYYVIGFHSTNPARNGAFRKLTVKVNVPDVKLEYRPGYYAPADYKHSNADEREQQLEEEMASDLPATDVQVYLQALYFRLDADRYYVPIELVVPGSQIPFQQGGSRDKATLDVVGQVKDSAGKVVGNVEDKVKLAVDQAQKVAQKNIQYSTGFTLGAGKYHVKFVVRENVDGKMGSFEADINVPNLAKMPLKMSSVVLASQRVPYKQKAANPLVRDGLEWIPNVAHVFRQDQHLYLLYEVYDPAKVGAVKAGGASAGASGGASGKQSASAASAGGVRVLTSIEFLSNGAKVFETPLVSADKINEPDKGAVAFQFDVPLTDLKPGMYVCQVNVVDDAGGAFTFPRVAMLVRGDGTVTPVPGAVPGPAATPSGAAPAGN
jgi:VWFA-related protein